jgi:hypothetical protein
LQWPRYVQLAHNRRVDGLTQAHVLPNLGREDQLDRDGLRRLVASINRYLGEPDGGPPPADAAQLAGDGLTVASRPAGTVHLLDGLWQALGVDAALRKVLGRAGSPPMWSGCCSRWPPTGPSTRCPRPSRRVQLAAGARRYLRGIDEDVRDLRKPLRFHYPRLSANSEPEVGG